MSPFSDEELIQKSKEGDKEAFKELFERYSGKIVSYIYCYVRDYQKAEDITLETFLDVYKRLPEYEERKKFLPWVYTIALNFARKEFRKEKKAQKEISLETPIGESKTASLGDLLGDNAEARPDYSLRMNELYDAVSHVLDELEEKYRDALVLCDMRGLPYEEAARILKCSKWAVGMRLTRARKLLYEALRKKNYI